MGHWRSIRIRFLFISAFKDLNMKTSLFFALCCVAAVTARSLTKKGVCPTLEEQLEKVKNNLAAEDSITDELAGHIYDALVKTAKELHTLEGEAPKEIMDLIVHQLNTVFHEAPQCWAWAEKFGF